jgi:hypothetical protein
MQGRCRRRVDDRTDSTHVTVITPSGRPTRSTRPHARGNLCAPAKSGARHRAADLRKGRVSKVTCELRGGTPRYRVWDDTVGQIAGRLRTGRRAVRSGVRLRAAGSAERSRFGRCRRLVSLGQHLGPVVTGPSG